MSLIYSRLPDGSVNPAWMEARRGKITAVLGCIDPLPVAGWGSAGGKAG